jgi:anaerobic magnesium-protoporphyrin IX monomethyl ester cyclase
MSDFDVLIIGGYSLTELKQTGSAVRDRIRLHSGNHPATVDYLKCLVDAKGDLPRAGMQYMKENQAKNVCRSLNTIYLYDFLTRRNIRTQAVNYFMYEQARFQQLMSSKPPIVVISTTFMCDIGQITTVARAVKALSPESIVIAGGIGILKAYKQYVLYHQGYFDGFNEQEFEQSNIFMVSTMDTSIDVFVIEESGELTLVELMRNIRAGTPYESTPNIAYYDNQGIVFTERVPEPYSFDRNPIAWDEIPEDIVGNEIPVRAGIGCPFKCGFCDFSSLHSRVQLRSIDSLITELKLIQATFPGRPIFFSDDNLFISRKRTRQLCEAIVENKLEFKWRAFFRVDAVSEENVDLIAQSGCVNALLGVESGSNAILNNMEKRATRELALRAVILLNGQGINTISSIIIGYPGETNDTIDETIDLLNSYPAAGDTINQYCPFAFSMLPLSPIASPPNRLKYGITGGCGSWSHVSMNYEEGCDHLIRCFHAIDGASLVYPEAMDGSLGAATLRSLLRRRDNLVKQGINRIDESNVQHVYQVFRDILDPEPCAA